ncbi:AAA domain-containing protein [bacterium]|jgi:ATP-dependent Clp protease ATP-binding subunit ClpX|nr:AAA domain-containing protein [bacterium]
MEKNTDDIKSNKDKKGKHSGDIKNENDEERVFTPLPPFNGDTQKADTSAKKRLTNIDDLASEITKLMGKSQGLKSKLFFQEFGQTEESKSDSESKDEPEPIDLAFDYIPKQIKTHLDRFVIKQDDAKKVLSIAVCDHFNHVKSCLKSKAKCKSYHKQNVIMVGPTGVGKTFLIQCIADLIGVPFIKSDATKFTETGYVGGDVEDLVRQLVAKANGNTDLAQYGIIYLDEIDKISGSSDKVGKDVSGRGVQSNLLKLMEETEVPLKTAWDIQSQLQGILGKKNKKKETINTRHILFIVSGAFDGLQNIVRKRVEGSKFGFERKNRGYEDNQLASFSSTQDFIDYGLESEFVGRLPVRVVCNSLDEHDLFKILKESEASILNQLIASFSYYDIETKISDKLLKKIASLAILEKTGARGLMTVIEKAFRDFKFELPNEFKGKWTVSDDILDGSEKELKKLKKRGSRLKSSIISNEKG